MSLCSQRCRWRTTHVAYTNICCPSVLRHRTYRHSLKCKADSVDPAAEVHDSRRCDSRADRHAERSAIARLLLTALFRRGLSGVLDLTPCCHPSKYSAHNLTCLGSLCVSSVHNCGCLACPQRAHAQSYHAHQVDHGLLLRVSGIRNRHLSRKSTFFWGSLCCLHGCTTSWCQTLRSPLFR